MPERLSELDRLRGIAVLGILPVNIFLFGWPEGGGNTVPGEFLPTITDRIIWGLVHLLFEQKFINLLSLLFGIGIGLFAERHIDGTTGRHARRMAALAGLGVLHAYLLWWGDILFVYALSGLLAWLALDRTPGVLLMLGLALYAVPSAMLMLWLGLDAESLSSVFAPPDSDALQTELELYRSGWWTQMQHRAPLALVLQTDGLLSFSLWQTLGLMLIGLAAHRLGLLRRDSPLRQYAKVIVALTLPLGLVLMALSLTGQLSAEPRQRHLAFQWQYWGSLCLTMAYLFGFLHWHARSARAVIGPAIRRLEATGRLALSSYLLQTLICTLLFYGHGLGYFGHWNALQLVVTAGLIILLLLWLCPLWERHFGTGPMERLWRHLAHRH